MKARDDHRFYAFIIATTSRSRSRIRRFSLHKQWVKMFAVVGLAILCAALYGVYGLTSKALAPSVELENEKLRAENERQRQQLNYLNNRVEAIEDKSRRLAEMSGVEENQAPAAKGSGGPEFLFGNLSPAALEEKTNELEERLRHYEAMIRERATVPSIWPIQGTLESNFGYRRNPFGGLSVEMHTGQDIEAGMGTPISATAIGTVTFAGVMNGYGNIVIVDHGEGVTTRYAHMSHIDAVVGQRVNRGDLLGRVGSTGRSTGPHLHYEVRINDHPVDPRTYLPGAGPKESSK